MSEYNGEPWKFRLKDGQLETLESMYGYQSPIEMIATEMRTKYENDCVSICKSYGFNVDKEELAKALAYDRDQYDKGYADAKRKYEKPQGDWIPVTYRPMTDEEEKEFCEKWGIKEGSLEDWEKRAFSCPLPDDGQEILISVGRYVHEDVCSWDEDCCGLENYGDWDGVDAWMPMPNAYKKGGDEE